MQDNIKNVMEVLYITEKDKNKSDELVLDVEKTFNLVKELQSVEVDENVEPLEYLNFSNRYENKMRSKETTRTNVENLEVEENNFYMVKK